MKTEKKTVKSMLRMFIIFALTVALAMSALLVVGCKDDGDANSSPTPTASPAIPPQSVGNGNFDLLYDNSDSNDYPRTPKEWSYSIDGTGDNKAPDSSSDLLHGVINVSDSDKFNSNVTGDNPKFGKLQNPGTPNTETKDKKNLLMLYNKKDTAIRYKSPAISVTANSYLKLTAWVKTMELEGSDASETTYAHINISGGLEEPVYVRNISTKGVTENNGYVRYEFYIEGSAYASKTVYIELGLGYGDRTESVNNIKGYAFFDDVELEYLAQKDYPATSDYSFRADGYAYGSEVNGEFLAEQVANVKGTTGTKSIAYSFVKDTDISGNEIEKTTDLKNNYSQVNPSFVNSGNLSTGTTNVDTIANLLANNKDNDDVLKNAPFPDDTQVLYMNNTTATSVGYRQTNLAALQPYKYYRLSMWVKTSDLGDKTSKFNMYLNDGETITGTNDPKNKPLSSFASVNTVDKDKDLTVKDAEKDYKWKNWQQYTFLVQTSVYQDESNISMDFFLGPQYKEANDLTFPYKLVKGYAYVTQPQVEELTATEYTSASTGDNATKTTLGETSSSAIPNGGFDTPTKSFGDYNFANGPLAPIDWKSYPHGYANVGGNDETVAPNKKQDIVHGITDRLLSNGDIRFDPGNFSALSMYAKNDTAMGYASNYVTFSANSYYRLSVKVMADADTKFGVYVVDKDGKILNDGTMKDGEKDPQRSVYFEKTGTGIETLNNEVDESKYTTYTFYFKTEYEAKNCRVELWVGNRTFIEGGDAAAQSAAYTTGEVIFDDVMLETGSDLLKDDFDQATAGETIIKVDYTESDPTPSASPSVSPSPSGSAEPGEKEPFNWAVLATGSATLLIIIALALVGIRKFILSPKHKPGKRKSKRVKDKENPERLNKYTSKKKHYDATDDEDDQDSDDEADEAEETEPEEKNEGLLNESPHAGTEEEEEDDLNIESMDHIEDLVDDEDDDKKDLD